MTPYLWISLVLLLLFRFWLGAEALVLFVFNLKKLSRYRIQAQKPHKKQIVRERTWSWISMFVDILILFSIFWVVNNGYSRMYWDLNERGLLYGIASLLLLLILQDAYFYFTHRWLHSKFMMKHIHHIHHISTNPTPWSSFCVHPIEKVIELVFFPVIIVLLPLHPWALIFFSYFSAISNLYGHSGYEFTNLGKLVISPYWLGGTSTFHNLHHQKFDCNYSLYLSLWDKILKTQHPKYAVDFVAVLDRRKSFESEN